MTQTPRANSQQAKGERSMVERPQRFRVMRAVQLTAGETTMPGAIIEQGADWPHRRAKQFVDQGYLAPIVTEEG